jgi:hypothetical protein
MRLFFLGLVLLFLFNAAGIQAADVVLNENPFDYTRPWALKEDAAGKLWTAYYALDGNLHLKGLNEKGIIINDEGKKRASSGLALETAGSHIYTVWREKTQEKKLLFRSSADSGKTLAQTMSLGGDTEPLTRIEMGHNKDSVYLAWLGEKRVDPKEKGGHKDYNIYFSSSRDSGTTFSAPVRVTEGYQLSIYPGLVVDESGAYVFSWSISQQDKKPYMVVRRFNQSEDRLDAPVNIAETKTVVSFKTFRAKDRLFCIWVHFTKRSDFMVAGAYSDDHGKKWNSFSLGDTEGMDIGSMDIAYDEEGHISIVYSGKTEAMQKTSVFLTRSLDNGTTWEKRIALRHYPFENTRATNPVAIKTKGEVVVAWEDWRNIRPGLYMNYSQDNGKTWQEADIPLTEPGKEGTVLDPLISSFLYKDGQYYLAAQRYLSDSLQERDLVLIKFKAGGVK